MKNHSKFLSIGVVAGFMWSLIPCQFSLAGQNWALPAGVSCDEPARSSSFASLAGTIRESVVAIVTSGSPEHSTAVFHDLRRIFPDIDSKQRSLGIGSGFVVRADGLVVTNEHVVAGAERVWVLLDGVVRKLPAKVLGADFRSDIALLKIDSPRPLRALTLGDSDTTEVGQWVMTMGNPYGISHLVTKGIISGKGRAINGLPHGKSRFFDFIQTDAAINRGNSGGPLVDLCGQVIGVNTAINARARGIGFAVPANLLRAVLPHLYEKGRLDRSYWGINVEDVSWELAQSFGMDSPKGVVVTWVRPGAPGDKAGLRTGDVIVEIGNCDVEGRTDLTWRVATLPAGQAVNVLVWRDEKTLALRVVSATRSKNEKSFKQEPALDISVPKEKSELGLKVTDLPDDFAGSGSESRAGVVVVKASSLAAEHGIRPGDVIVEVNGKSLGSPIELRDSLQRIGMGKMVRFYVLRQRVGHFIALRKSWED